MFSNARERSVFENHATFFKSAYKDCFGAPAFKAVVVAAFRHFICEFKCLFALTVSSSALDIQTYHSSVVWELCPGISFRSHCETDALCDDTITKMW